MKERRKRRSAKDVENSILDAASQLIEENGFSKLTVTGIMQLAEIEPVQFYKRYEDLSQFIDNYVKKFDYWFSDIVESHKKSSNEKELYLNILTDLFNSLSENKVMQQLLRWELSDNNETTQRTARLRELHTLPLCRKFADQFSGSKTDIVAISALVVGGIYYLVLHDELSSFSGLDLKKETDRQRVTGAIKELSNILFSNHSLTKETIDSIVKMKNDNMPIEKIEYYTGVPKEIIVSI